MHRLGRVARDVSCIRILSLRGHIAAKPGSRGIAQGLPGGQCLRILSLRGRPWLPGAGMPRRSRMDCGQIDAPASFPGRAGDSGSPIRTSAPGDRDRCAGGPSPEPRRLPRAIAVRIWATAPMTTGDCPTCSGRARAALGGCSDASRRQPCRTGHPDGPGRVEAPTRGADRGFDVLSAHPKAAADQCWLLLNCTGPRNQPAYPQAHGDVPREPATLSATAICWSGVARSGREA